METQKRWCKRNAQATNTRLGCYMVLKNSKGEQEGWRSNMHMATGVKKRVQPTYFTDKDMNAQREVIYWKRQSQQQNQGVLNSNLLCLCHIPASHKFCFHSFQAFDVLNLWLLPELDYILSVISVIKYIFQKLSLQLNMSCNTLPSDLHSPAL